MTYTHPQLKDLFDQPALSALADRLEVGIQPTDITLNGNEVVVSYLFEGRGASILFEAAWSFTYGRFYCLKTASSDYLFGAPEPLLLTESELLTELEEFFASGDFELVSRPLSLLEDEVEYLISRFRA